MSMRLHGLILVFGFILLATSSSTAQSITSAQNGPWNLTSTWAGGVIPDFSNSTAITVAHNINIPSGYSVTVDQLSINVSRTLTIDNGGTMIVTNGTGNDLTFNTGFGTAKLNVDGLLRIDDGATIGNPSSTRLTIQSRGIYRHNYVNSGGTIYAATWNPPTPGPGSTLEFTGYGSIGDSPAGLNQTFHHVTWNCSAQGNFVDLNLSGTSTKINGNFPVSETTGQFLVLSQDNYTLDILGDFIISGNSSVALNGFAVTTADINVSGNFSYTSSAESWFAVDGATTLDILGTMTINSSGGSIDLSNNSGGSTGSSIVTIPSTFTFTNGTLTNSADVTSCTLRFTGNTTYSKGGSASYNGRINFDVIGTLDLGTSEIAGTGTLNVNSASSLLVGSTDVNGAIQTGTLAGNVRVSGTRTYSSGSTISYNGTAAQFIGNGHPTSSGVDITIANSNGVSIIAPTTLAGTINLTSGNLNIGSSSLTITGNITGSNSISIGSLGGLTVGGSANIGTFPFTAGVQTFTNFSLDNTNGITFGNDVTLSGALTLTNGTLVYNNRTLTLNGTISSSAGILSGNSSSTLSIGGTGAFGTLPITPGNSIGTLEFNRSSGTASLNSSLIVTSSFNLLNGDFTNTNGLQMANGSTLTRSSNAQLLANAPTNLPAGQFYNVIYTGGAQTTGLELPISSNDDLGALTINASGQVTLGQPIIINGNLTLQSSTFSAGSNLITMRGSTWSRAGGNFSPGTGEVRFDGNTTITTSAGNPRFGNLRVESSRTLTFPSTTVEISGNITLLAGATINNSGGTLYLDGTGTQNIGAGGATLANITVAKSSGSVSLTNALNITGVLDITTATVFASAGNLTLRSTSDGTSGNASIADLSAGGSVSGNVTVQRYMSGEGRVWRYLSSPIQNATVASWKDDFPITGSFSDPSTPGEWPGISPLTSSTISMYRYDETVVGSRDLGWEAFPTSGLASANPLEVGRGYSAFVRVTPSAAVIDVTGPINSGDIALPVTLTGSGSENNDNGWNIVGNPYPSTIDWDDASWTKTNISGTVQIRDDPSGIFQTWNGSIGSMGSGRIAQGQGFWVQAIGAPTLIVREGAKVNTTGTFYKQDTQVPNAFEIVLSKGTKKDYAYLWFKDEASQGVDPAYDAPKFNNEIFDFSILTPDGTKLAINTLPFLSCGSELKIDISTANEEFDLNGAYTIAFNELGWINPDLKLRLVDTFENVSTEVINGGLYNFEISGEEGSFGSKRFKLVLVDGVAPFEIEQVTGATNCNSGSVTLSATGAPVGGIYKWYDSESAVVAIAETSASAFTTPVLDKTKTYFVSVANELGCESAKSPVIAQIINYDEVEIEIADNKLVSSYSTGNQWYRDGVMIPGATEQIYTPSESGMYKVEVSLEGCSTSSARAFTVTDLEDESFFEGNVQVFPNPVSDLLTIKIKEGNVESPRIVDMQGKLIGAFDMKQQKDYSVGIFSFEGRAQGIYILQVSDLKGNVYNKRIIKK